MSTSEAKAKAKTAAGPVKPISTGWQLTKQALRGYRAHWITYALLVAVVAIPSSYVSTSSTLSVNDGASSYMTILGGLMYVVLVYAVGRALAGEPLGSVKRLYFDGSAALLRFVVIALIMSITLVPLAVAMSLLSVANAQVGAIGVLGFTLVSLIALLIAFFSAWPLARFVFGLYAVIQDGYDPIPALRFSRKLGMGRFWRILLRLMFLVLMTIVVSIVVYLLFMPLALIGLQGAVLAALFSSLLSILGLPFVSLYITYLYRELKAAA
jgi:hypothetical protein